MTHAICKATTWFSIYTRQCAITETSGAAVILDRIVLFSVSVLVFEGQGLLIQVICISGVGRLVGSKHSKSVRLHLDSHSRQKGGCFTRVYVDIYKFPSYPPSSPPSNPIKDLEI